MAQRLVNVLKGTLRAILPTHMYTLPSSTTLYWKLKDFLQNKKQGILSFLGTLRKPSIIQNVSKNCRIFLALKLGEGITPLSMQDTNGNKGFSIYVFEYSVLWQINLPPEALCAPWLASSHKSNQPPASVGY